MQRDPRTGNQVPSDAYPVYRYRLGAFRVPQIFTLIIMAATISLTLCIIWRFADLAISRPSPGLTLLVLSEAAMIFGILGAVAFSCSRLLVWTSAESLRRDLLEHLLSSKSSDPVHGQLLATLTSGRFADYIADAEPEQARIEAAGRWVLDRFSHGDAVVALPVGLAKLDMLKVIPGTHELMFRVLSDEVEG